VPFVSSVGIEFQINVSVLRETKFLYIPVSMADADEEFFHMIVRRINAQITVIDVELQDTVIHE
jgi:hypothetical protein